MKIKLVLIALLTIGITLLFVACSKAVASCYDSSKDYASQVTQIASDFDSADKVANNTDPMNLVTPITSLRDLMKKATDLTVPECAHDAHALLLNYMNSTIEKYMAIWSNYSSDANDHAKQAESFYNSWTAAVKSLQIPPTP